MSLIKSHNHSRFQTKFRHSEKVSFEPLDGEEGVIDKPRIEYRYTYYLSFGFHKCEVITFVCHNEPKIETINNQQSPKKYLKKNIQAHLH